MFMRTGALVLLTLSVAVVLADQQPPSPAADANPLLTPWTTPFGVPPFAEIKPSHFVPAIKEGIAQQRRDVEAIAANPQAPTFANTIEALENTGELLNRVTPVFSNL
jgi:peptidyl-dipeptidase Dcp